MRAAPLFFTLAFVACSASVQAASTLYRVVQPDGKIVYTNERVPGAQPVRPDDVPPPPPTAPPPPGPGDVPRDATPQAGTPKGERVPLVPKPAAR
jgi:hypothetical protein